ncbi:MAG: MarR family winged helix-turn-helix transcriptional regulator [Actinoplanes sp.]
MSDATPHRDLLVQIREALKAVRVFKGRLAPHTTAVPPGTLGILGAIGTGRGSHVKDLAADCALDPSTVSRAVAALVKADLVERAADPDDGRASVLAVTDHGRNALDTVVAQHEEQLAEALHDWTPEELAAFSAMLRRFTNDLITTKLLEAAR